MAQVILTVTIFCIAVLFLIHCLLEARRINSKAKRRSAVFVFLLIIVLTYFSNYLAFRHSNIQTWKKNEQQYVIFPKEQIAIYYLFRPASYLDGILTGMGAHIGPHAENTVN
ncbi:MAG: hypothetical protein PHW04_13135 [Candidatus Wallbacteria bacterium]|nr:hypothetical protein [Candidatus Wallbacteria bacterium]